MAMDRVDRPETSGRNFRGPSKLAALLLVSLLTGKYSYGCHNLEEFVAQR
jgi:hypothetical protein